MRDVRLEQLYSGNIGTAHMLPCETEHRKFYQEREAKILRQLEVKPDEQGRCLLN